MPAVPGYQFCTRDHVIAFSVINPAYSGRNDRIDSMIAAATTDIMSACNRDFVAKTNVIEYFPTPDRYVQEYTDPVSSAPYVIYPKEPNVSNLSVWLGYGYVWDSDYLLVVDRDYYVETMNHNPALTRINLLCSLRHHGRSLKIQYNSGYPEDAMPDEIIQATAIQAGHLMSRAAVEDIGTGDTNKQSARRDPRTRPGGVVSEVAHKLRNWRRSLTGPM